MRVLAGFLRGRADNAVIWRHPNEAAGMKFPSRSLPSPCRIADRETRTTSVGLVQTKWFESADAHTEQLTEGVSACAEAGANVVFLPELTLSRVLRIRDLRAPQTPQPRTWKMARVWHWPKHWLKAVMFTCRFRCSASGLQINVASIPPSLCPRSVGQHANCIFP